MSWQWVRRVLEASASTGGARLVLLALADRANNDGECWPSAADIARRAKLSQGQTRRHLRTLRALGELVIVTPGGGLRPGREKGIPNRYRLTLPELPEELKANAAPIQSPKPNGERRVGNTCAPALGYAPALPLPRPQWARESPAKLNGNADTCAPMLETSAPTTANPSANAREPARRREGKQQEQSEKESKNYPNPDFLLKRAVAAVDPGERAFLQTMANRKAQARSGDARPLGAFLGKFAPQAREAPLRRILDGEQDRTRALLKTVRGLLDVDAADLAMRFPYERMAKAVETLGTKTVRNPGGWLRRAAENGWTADTGGGGDGGG